jgi:hypothetical protein
VRAYPEHTSVASLTSLPPLPAVSFLYNPPAPYPRPLPVSVIARTCARPSSTAAGFLNDVYRFSAAANTWTPLSPSGSGPSPRSSMGFVATPDGMLYVFGGDETIVFSTGIGKGRGAGGGRGGRGGGQLWWMGLVAWPGMHSCSMHVPDRCSQALPPSSVSTRVRREETSRCMCVFAELKWAIYVQFYTELAISSYALSRDKARQCTCYRLSITKPALMNETN